MKILKYRYLKIVLKYRTWVNYLISTTVNKVVNITLAESEYNTSHCPTPEHKNTQAHMVMLSGCSEHEAFCFSNVSWDAGAGLQNVWQRIPHTLLLCPLQGRNGKATLLVCTRASTAQRKLDFTEPKANLSWDTEWQEPQNILKGNRELNSQHFHF